MNITHLSPHTVVPQRAGSRVTALGLGRFDSFITVTVTSSFCVLTDDHSPLKASGTGTGTLLGTNSDNKRLFRNTKK